MACVTSGDGHFLAIAAGDGTVRVWPMARLRRRLADMKLDFPAPPLAHPAYDTTRPGTLSLDDKPR